MAINNYDGFLKYKQDNGDIAVLYPKTKVANVEGAATAASVTPAYSGGITSASISRSAATKSPRVSTSVPSRSTMAAS